MRISLSLLAAAVLAVLTTATPAHAAVPCPSWSLFSAYAFSQAKAGFPPGLVCSIAPAPYNPTAVDGCGMGGSALASTVYFCTQAGVTGTWILTKNASCWNSPMRIDNSVVYSPNHLYTFHETCICSEGTSSCSWQ